MAQSAPVCHIPPKTVTTQPGPASLQSIPPAEPNLASLTATVNAMRQILMFYTGQQGPPGRQGAQGKSAPSGSWEQVQIQTENVKIYQNNDPSTGNFVEVQRINKLVMGNKVTNQTWTFNRPPDPSA